MSEKSPEAVYESLVNLGLPKESVSLEEFRRLYRGTLQDALSFISEHVRGRAAVIEAHTQLLGYSEFCGNSKIKQRSASDIALSRLAKARNDVQVYSNQLADLLQAAQETHSQNHALNTTLDSKRHVESMLETLERRELERMRRFVEIRKMLFELKRKIPQTLSSSQPNPTPWQCSEIPPRKPTKVRDVMIALNAHHVRLARLAHSSSRSNIQSAEARLRRRVAQNLGVEDENDPEVNRVLQEFMNAARHRALEQIRFRSAVERAPMMSTKQLDVLASQADSHATILQDAFSSSLELAKESEQAIASISNFRSTIAPTQKRLIHARLAALENYVDRLRAHCVTAGQSQTSSQTPKFDLEVRKVLDLSDASTSAQVLDKVERLVRSVHSKSERLHATRINLPPLPSTEEIDTLAFYESRKAELESSSEKLLTRKIGKADLGQGLIEDIETLLKEVNVIIATEHRSDKASASKRVRESFQ
ncbi:hypothetical protein D9757_003966 [Collybiopsis confluens]|uniref:Uncharacterized protein n=1 Tax=Collybiopsis confluens TaxID=2823264 RepID=A0A8H5HWQ7_9AGAR|nr:hypothetical protein D9757_003966 [Collybiopsis confluens]